MVVDLHLHTTASDGSYTPQEIVARARELGFKAIAITDHDTTEGVVPARAAGQELGVEIIPGIELSTDAAGREIHILGFLMNLEDEKFKDVLAKMSQARTGRGEKIVEKLQEQGLDITYEEVKKMAGASVLGRPHVAKVLLDKGYIGSIKEAFEKYLGSGKPAHVPRYKITPQEAVQLIREARGIPVLAHPGLADEGEELVNQLIEAGLLGLEAYHSDHDQATTHKFLSLARAKGLLVTGGSDCHGPLFKNKELMGTIRAPYQLVEDLKEKHKFLYGS